MKESDTCVEVMGCSHMHVFMAGHTMSGFEKSQACRNQNHQRIEPQQKKDVLREANSAHAREQVVAQSIGNLGKRVGIQRSNYLQ